MKIFMENEKEIIELIADLGQRISYLEASVAGLSSMISVLQDDVDYANSILREKNDE